jgi:arylsulfatase A-like enzyme
LGNEACNFIDKNAKAKSPFFLYLPFNAVHAPLQAPEEDIKRFNTGNHNRDVQLAMIYRMDIAIGKVIQKLKDDGVYENTILIFLTDNGGAKATSANNLPLRDFKHSVYEGGLRIPFLLSWPAKYKHSVCNEAVMSFDILPTICAALKIKLPTDKIYDGKSILPAIKGKLKEPLHKNLFWDGNDNIWAVREGNWKLIFNKAKKLELYNLENDLSETKDLSAQHPEKVADMKIKFDTWRSEMKTPMGDSKKGGKKAKNNSNKQSGEE